MQRFIFLEILDPEIHALLNGLKKEFGGKPAVTNIHITVRGPYNSSIPPESIEKFEQTLREVPLLIHSAGMFEHTKEYLVYLKIESQNLMKIWWKPDFPVEEYGFNPHIPLYKGNDKRLANCIYDFLKEENIELLCRDFKLTSYVSKQRDFFPDDSRPKEKHFLQLANRKLVRTDILQRAYNVVRKCKAQHVNNQLNEMQ